MGGTSRERLKKASVSLWYRPRCRKQSHSATECSDPGGRMHRFVYTDGAVDDGSEKRIHGGCHERQRCGFSL